MKQAIDFTRHDRVAYELRRLAFMFAINGQRKHAVRVTEAANRLTAKGA